MSVHPTLLRDKRTEARALSEYDQDVGECQSEFLRIHAFTLVTSFHAYCPSKIKNLCQFKLKPCLYYQSVVILLRRANYPVNQWAPGCSIDISYHFMCLEIMATP